jgi:hypothetical protein
MIVLPKGIPQNEIPGWLVFYSKLENKNVLARVVIWK